MILLKSISESGLRFEVVDGDLCAVANTYAIDGRDVIEVTAPDERGYRQIKIIIVKDVGDLTIDWVDGIYQIDNNSDMTVVVSVDYVRTKKQRGRVITSAQWAKTASDRGVPSDAIILANTAFDRSTSDDCGVGGFYLMLSK